MLNRRRILAAGGVAALGTSMSDAEAATVEVELEPNNQSPAQKKLHGVRFEKLDDNSQQDFVKGFKLFMQAQAPYGKPDLHLERFLSSRGLSGTADTNLGYEECFRLLLEDPVYAARARLSASAQHLMWDRAQRVFHRDREKYLSAMEETDRRGPGSLELSPDLVIPEYTSYEIHTQPGGFVGDAFAGWMYHYALTLSFFTGTSDYDEIFLSIAKNHPLPTDGTMNRALDLGCGTGQSTTAIKERFPDAEVWGIEIGAPMVRYAHYRACKMNLAVNFRHGLAEDTRFPDGYFDLVTDHIMFHEVTAAAAKKIVAETYRILRPGGIFHHVDVPTAGHPYAGLPKSIPSKAATWSNHRYNHEPWILQYSHSDFPQILRDAGFKVDFDGDPNRRGMYPKVIATKPA